MPRLDDLDADRFIPERVAIVGRELFLYLPDGIGRSKLAVDLARPKRRIDGTTRNWRTVMKLVELANNRADD